LWGIVKERRSIKRELSLARQVTHKNVLRIYDLGEVNGLKYISMPFIDGEDLATMLRRELLPIDRASLTAVQLCAGLAAAHQAGVVHRDLKPANVMVGRNGDVYLTDFGIARSVDATQFTATGAVVGTPDYMSPEQVSGEAADVQSDIYSLGVIFYELFTGERPFKGETPMSRLSERVHTPARNPRDTNPQVPLYVAKIIMRCMERDRLLRYSSVDEILTDFENRRSSEQPWHVHAQTWPFRMPFLVLELVEGDTLADVIRSREKGVHPARPSGGMDKPGRGIRTPNLIVLGQGSTPFNASIGDRTRDVQLGKMAVRLNL